MEYLLFAASITLFACSVLLLLLYLWGTHEKPRPPILERLAGARRAAGVLALKGMETVPFPSDFEARVLALEVFSKNEELLAAAKSLLQSDGRGCPAPLQEIGTVLRLLEAQVQNLETADNSQLVDARQEWIAASVRLASLQGGAAYLYGSGRMG